MFARGFPGVLDCSEGGRMKRMTRKQVAGWFLPIRRALNEMLSGEVDSIRGYAVTRLHHGDEYERVDYCIAGFVGVISRIFKERDISALTKIEKRLANGAPVTVADIEDALALLKSLETPLVKADWHEIKSALTTEMISIELDEIREAA